jgi:hypothetical protein
MEEREQEWHFVVCQAGPPIELNEMWTHRTTDGGGLDFEFFWHPLISGRDENWHPVFKRALEFIGQHAKDFV